mmetsp:Transcript_24863/g.40759  ORF Transcript_24863/g.40759 Transcript_24863/m.40759 type:complete len:90 (+) Transcript_24863:573-842(+)
MVALLLNHVPDTQGMAKERLIVLAEETGVNKESMSGDGGSFYDGWSGMKQRQDRPCIGPGRKRQNVQLNDATTGVEWSCCGSCITYCCS